MKINNRTKSQIASAKVTWLVIARKFLVIKTPGQATTQCEEGPHILYWHDIRQLYVCVYVCMYVCMYVRMYVYMYVSELKM